MLLRLTEAGITIWNGKKTIYQGTYVVCVGLRIFAQKVNDLQIASRKITSNWDATISYKDIKNLISRNLHNSVEIVAI